MKLRFCLLMITASGLALRAQQAPLEERFSVQEGSPQALLITRINEEADDQKRVALCLEYEKKYVKSDTIVWVFDQLRSTYLKLNKKAEALDVSRRTLQADPENIAAVHALLEDAAERKDPAAERDWALKAHDLAKRVIATTGPGPDEEPNEWKQRVTFAKQLNTLAEYELYMAATRSPKDKDAILQLLAQRFPSSQYLHQQQATARVVLSGDAGLAAIDKAIAEGKADDEMALTAANYYLQRNAERAAHYCTKLIEIANGPKPASVPDGDWPRRRGRALGQGYWMLGMIASSSENYAAADKHLRAALNYLRGDDQKMAAALFHLGYANFRLAGSTTDKTRVQDAIRFTEQCIKMDSSVKNAAMQNLARIKSQYNMQ